MHLALAEEMQQFERPMPLMDEYDSLLTHTTTRNQMIQ
jgi:hypothetical protein